MLKYCKKGKGKRERKKREEKRKEEKGRTKSEKGRGDFRETDKPDWQNGDYRNCTAGTQEFITLLSTFMYVCKFQSFF